MWLQGKEKTTKVHYLLRNINNKGIKTGPLHRPHSYVTATKDRCITEQLLYPLLFSQVTQ